MAKYLFLTIFIALFCGTAYAEIAAPSSPTPSLKTTIQPSVAEAGDKVEYIVEISWRGDSNLFMVAPPKINLPDGLASGGLQNSVRVENLQTIKTYSYEILTSKAGDFSIAPVEFALRNNSTGEELKLKTYVVKIELKESKNIFSKRLGKLNELTYNQRLGFILIFLGALIGIIVLVTTIKNKKTVEKSETTRPEKESKSKD